jgi:F0F1-type ATP synthase epsilon subunit
MDNNITISIRNKQGLIFKDKVKAVSSYNEKGLFDILPEHENFISLIKEKIVIHKNDDQKEEIKIGSGVLRAYENNVNIYVGI